MNKSLFYLFILPLISYSQTFSNSFYIGDPLPDAPVLAARGKHKVGVKTLQVKNPEQIDVLNSNKDETVLYDRPLTLEIWYPSALQTDEVEEVIYEKAWDDFLETNGGAKIVRSFLRIMLATY